MPTYLRHQMVYQTRLDSLKTRDIPQSHDQVHLKYGLDQSNYLDISKENPYQHLIKSSFFSLVHSSTKLRSNPVMT